VNLNDCFPTTGEYLAALRSASVSRDGVCIGPVKHPFVPKQPPPVDLTADDQTPLKQILACYHQIANNTPEFLA
jgi:hypothetical protein